MWEFVLLTGGRISIPNADIYILAAWHSAYEQLLGLGGRTGVLWTSSGGEMDFEPIEQEYLRRVREDPRISFIWFGDLSLAKIYPEKGFYAPYPMDVDEVNPPDVEKKDIATLFCPTGPKKNILNQLLAMKLVQRERKLTLHTNVQVNVPGVAGYHVEGLEVEVHSWLGEAEYHRLLASAKVNLACSWAETFNYNVAEAALLGTTSVTSPTISIPGIMAINPNSPAAIAKKILECEAKNLKIQDFVRPHLETQNQECKRILGERLSAL